MLKWALAIAALIAGTATAVADQSPGPRAKSEMRAKIGTPECRQEELCWGIKALFAANTSCHLYIERKVELDFRWLDTRLEDERFTHFRWEDKTNDTVTVSGDMIAEQNSLGNWLRSTYECDIDPSNGVISGVRLRQGRLR